MPRKLAPAHEIRTFFAQTMSDMYQAEVPLYGRLLEIVKHINGNYLQQHPSLQEQLGD